MAPNLTPRIKPLPIPIISRHQKSVVEDEVEVRFEDFLVLRVRDVATVHHVPENRLNSRAPKSGQKWMGEGGGV